MFELPEIAVLTSQINDMINSSWGILEEGQQDVKREEYLEYLDDLNELAQERLDLAQQQAIDSAAELKEAVREAMDEAAAVQLEAAHIQRDSASLFSRLFGEKFASILTGFWEPESTSSTWSLYDDEYGGSGGM